MIDLFLTNTAFFSHLLIDWSRGEVNYSFNKLPLISLFILLAKLCIAFYDTALILIGQLQRSAVRYF